MGLRRQAHFVTVDARATYTGVAGLVTNSDVVVMIQHGGTQAIFERLCDSLEGKSDLR